MAGATGATVTAIVTPEQLRCPRCHHTRVLRLQRHAPHAGAYLWCTWQVDLPNQWCAWFEPYYLDGADV